MSTDDPAYLASRWATLPGKKPLDGEYGQREILRGLAMTPSTV